MFFNRGNLLTIASQVIAGIFVLSGGFKLIQFARQLGLAGYLPTLFEYCLLIISVCEVVFAGLLWSSPKSKSLNTVGLFVIGLLTSYEVKMVMSDVKSCGCFGEWETHPLFVLVLCLATTVLLLLVRTATSFKETVSSLKGLVASIVIAFLLFADGFFSVSARVSSATSSESSISVAKYGQLFDSRDNTTVNFEVVVRNESDSNISIVGTPFMCGISLDEPLPIVLEPRKARIVRFSIKKPEKLNWVKLPVEFFVEDRGVKHYRYAVYAALNLGLHPHGKVESPDISVEKEMME